MAEEQGLFRHPFYKGRKIAEMYQYNPVHIVYQTVTSPHSFQTKFQKQQTRQPTFNCLLS